MSYFHVSIRRRMPSTLARVSGHVVADVGCLRQQKFVFHFFHNLTLSQKLDPHLWWKMSAGVNPVL